MELESQIEEIHSGAAAGSADVDTVTLRKELVSLEAQVRILTTESEKQKQKIEQQEETLEETSTFRKSFFFFFFWFGLREFTINFFVYLRSQMYSVERFVSSKRRRDPSFRRKVQEERGKSQICFDCFRSQNEHGDCSFKKSAIRKK